MASFSNALVWMGECHLRVRRGCWFPDDFVVLRGDPVLIRSCNRSPWYPDPEDLVADDWQIYKPQLGTFAKAMEALAEGAKVRRSSWPRSVYSAFGVFPIGPNDTLLSHIDLGLYEGDVFCCPYAPCRADIKATDWEYYEG